MDNLLLELLFGVEKSLSLLSGYIHGLAFKPYEPELKILESEVLSVTEDTKKEEITVNIIFDKKELRVMKSEFRKAYNQSGITLRVRKKGSVYEIRYRRDGLSLSASSKVLTEAKEKMRDLLKEAYSIYRTRTTAPRRKKAVEYCFWYLDTVKKPVISAEHYKNLVGYMNNDISPFFKDRYLSQVTYNDLQSFLNKYVAAGKYRTAQGVRTLLREIYKSAVLDGEIKVNHAERLTPISYEQEHGRALSRQEEKKAIQAILNSESIHKNDFLIILFTGCRPCELSTIRYEGDFILIDTAKQRKGKSKVRKVPMTPIFKQFVNLAWKPSKVETKQLWKSLVLILENVTTYDLRHTFITRAQECGVPLEVVQAWVGHSPRTLTGKTYTHYDDDYMQKMAQKLDYFTFTPQN